LRILSLFLLHKHCKHSRQFAKLTRELCS